MKAVQFSALQSLSILIDAWVHSARNGYASRALGCSALGDPLRRHRQRRSLLRDSSTEHHMEPQLVDWLD